MMVELEKIREDGGERFVSLRKFILEINLLQYHLSLLHHVVRFSGAYEAFVVLVGFSSNLEDDIKLTG